MGGGGWALLGLAEMWPIMAASNGYSLGLNPQTLPDVLPMSPLTNWGLFCLGQKKKEWSAKTIVYYKKYNK